MSQDRIKLNTLTTGANETCATMVDVKTNKFESPRESRSDVKHGPSQREEKSKSGKYH